MKKKIAVLGGGIQGVTVALALSKNKNNTIYLIDKNCRLFTQASNVNEGKIHLGFVYAKDTTFKTTDKMLQHGMEFGPLVENLLDRKLNWPDLVAKPFCYLISEDSMVGVDDLLNFYAELNERYKNLICDKSLHYLGQRPPEIFYPDKSCNRKFGNVQDAVMTEERSVNPALIGEQLTAKVQNLENVTCRLNYRIDSIEKTKSGFKIEGLFHDKPWADTFDIVVNCLWDQRLKLDAQLGILPEYRWVYRLKYRLIVDLPFDLKDLDSYTIVLGRFGDIVTYPGNSNAYLSWYPTCLQGWSEELGPPGTWDKLNGQKELNANGDIAKGTLRSLDEIIPGIAQSKVINLDSGIIFSRGHTDISDHNSHLHERYDIGVRAYDGYFSINTGKFTSAPSNARDLVKLIEN